MRGMGNDGIWVSNDGTVSGVTVSSNGGAGIIGGQNSTLSRNRARLKASSTVTHNAAQLNGLDGIFVGEGGTALGNMARRSTRLGLRMFVTGAGISGGYAHNALTGNNGGDANPQVEGGIELGTNLCGADTICP